MRRIIGIFGIITWCMGFPLQAQTVQEHFVDGSIYLKINTKVMGRLLVLDADHTWESYAKQLPEDLKKVLGRYQISRIEPAFKTRDPELDPIYRVRFRALEAVDELVASLNPLSAITYAEKIPLVRKLYEPNDYSPFLDLYHLDVINAQAAWDITQGNPEVVIAVVDDAVDTRHEDLAADIWINPGEIANNGIDDDGNGFIDDVTGYDVASSNNNPNPPNDNFSHGTHVAGCAAADTDNGRGVPSIGFNCQIMAVRASSNANSQGISDGYEGVDYAMASGADIINMSWGGPGFSNTHQTLMNVAHRRGIILVAAAGNDNNAENSYPVGYQHVIGVAATDRNDRKASFSSFGLFVDVSAPGVDILSTIPGAGNNRYGTNSGTSFSSPIVAGLLGLMRSVNPCLSPDEAEAILKETAVDIDGENPDFAGQLGAGRIDAAAAVAAALNAEGSGTPEAPIADFSFDNSDNCSNIIPFKFELDESSGTCAFSLEYRWTISNEEGFEVVKTERDPRVEIPASGTYTVSLRVSNAGGADTKTETLTFNTNPSAFIDAGESFIVCRGDSVVLEASTTADIQSVQWEPATNLNNASLLTPTFTANRAGGVYKLRIEGADGCVLEDSIQIDVFRPPFLRTTPDADTLIGRGDTIQLSATGGIVYEWSPAEGLSDPSIPNPLAFPDTTTTYMVTTTGVGDCVSQKSITIQITATPLSPLLDEHISLHPPFPNPAKDRVTFSADLKRATRVGLSLWDMQGRKVFQWNEMPLSVGAFSLEWEKDSKVTSGVYWVRWEVAGRTGFQKLLIQ